MREKAKQLEALLKDEERLKNERAKALKARERFAQQTIGFGAALEANVTNEIPATYPLPPTFVHLPLI